MKIGIIKEGKQPPDKRVPFTPKQCKRILDQYPDVEILVQKSKVRAFSDQEYNSQGIRLVEDLDEADIIFGVKEVNKDDLIAKKRFFFFSHTIKKQPYNRDLLQTVLNQSVTLTDYECLTDKEGSRILGFGRYAGIVGTYNGFLTFGKRSDRYQLKPAHDCSNKEELIDELKKVHLPKGFKIAITGMGRVAGGSIEILEALKIKRVSPADYLKSNFDEAFYTQLSVEEYFKKPNGANFDREEVFAHPERFERNFMPYAKVTDLYISCHFWDDRGPVIFTLDEMRTSDFKIRTIADISCDIAGPIPSTIRPSSIEDPIYEIDRNSAKEVSKSNQDTITVMAVDNLPCELPRDASEDFGNALIERVLPTLLGEDPDNIIERATIAKEGKLTDEFSYLQDYVEGKD